MSEEILPKTEKPKPIPKSRKRKQLKTFTVIRRGDESGVSGIGRVLNGVVFQDGACVIRWCSEVPSSVSYDSFEDFERVHITSHPENKSEIIWGKDCKLNEKVAEIRKLSV
jgi:hypothetical protein